MHRRKNGRWLQGEAILLIIIIRLGLTLLPFKTVHRTLMNLAHKCAPTDADRNESPERIIWAVDAASRCVPGSSCLVQAYALHISLARRGIPTSIRIGVQRNHLRHIDAHAWVEKDGQVLIGDIPDLSFYTALSSLGE